MAYIPYKTENNAPGVVCQVYNRPELGGGENNSLNMNKSS
jgi:hypothetical protein